MVVHGLLSQLSKMTVIILITEVPILIPVRKADITIYLGPQVLES